MWNESKLPLLVLDGGVIVFPIPRSSREAAAVLRGMAGKVVMPLGAEVSLKRARWLVQLTVIRFHNHVRVVKSLKM